MKVGNWEKAVLFIVALVAMFMYWKFCYTLDGFGGLFFGDICKDDTTEYASGYSDSGFRRLRKGMTEEDVRALLGEPLLRLDIATQNKLSPGGSAKAEAWRYSRTPNDGSYRKRIVCFEDGKVDTVLSEYWLD